jgi:hypothetical protein
VGSSREGALQAAVGQLIVSRKFTVARQGRDITLVKLVGKRPVTIMLKRLDGASFWIENPERDDRCVNSFLDYTTTPKRVTRNKDLIRFVVKYLKETSLWNFIENKDFFTVNKFNKKAKKKVVSDLFNNIRNG